MPLCKWLVIHSFWTLIASYSLSQVLSLQRSPCFSSLATALRQRFSSIAVVHYSHVFQETINFQEFIEGTCALLLSPSLHLDQQMAVLFSAQITLTVQKFSFQCFVFSCVLLCSLVFSCVLLCSLQYLSFRLTIHRQWPALANISASLLQKLLLSPVRQSLTYALWHRNSQGLWQMLLFREKKELKLSEICPRELTKGFSGSFLLWDPSCSCPHRCTTTAKITRVLISLGIFEYKNRDLKTSYGDRRYVCI